MSLATLMPSQTNNESRPQLTARGLTIYFSVWLIYSLLFANILSVSANLPYFSALVSTLLYNVALILCSIPSWFLIVRGLHGKDWKWLVLAHLTLGAVMSLAAQSIYFQTFRLTFGEAIFEGSGVKFSGLWIVWSYFSQYVLQFAIYHIVYSVRRLRKEEKLATSLRELARESEISALKAQLNPHFLFNTLNTISAMIGRDPDAARTMIAQLAELLRFALDSFDRQQIPLREELDFVNLYLEIERKRFPDRLEIQRDIDEVVLEEEVPPMILQPLVENAVQHGIAKAEDGGLLTLVLKRRNGYITVCVHNTGAAASSYALPKLSTGGIGLRNTDQRLRKLYGASAALQIEKPADGAFEVRFKIPAGAN